MKGGQTRLGIEGKAPDFSLPGVDGRTYSLSSFQDKTALIVIFSCNHCPYVQAYEDRLIAIQRDYLSKGVQLVAINANQDRDYPEDSFDEMVKRAKLKGYNFPYLRDASQAVAKAYGAAHTPEIFLLGPTRTLMYTGLVDDNWKDAAGVKIHHLRTALNSVLAKEPVNPAETFAIGCTIKWKPD